MMDFTYIISVKSAHTLHKINIIIYIYTFLDEKKCIFFFLDEKPKTQNVIQLVSGTRIVSLLLF